MEPTEIAAFGEGAPPRVAEELLRESEERYRAVVTQTGESIYLIDAQTKRVLESNPAFQRLLGYTAEELKTLTLYDFVAHPRVDTDFHMSQVLKQKHHVHGERKQRRKDGTLVDVEVTANLITYSGRKVICVVARDISERKEAERALRESEKKLRTLVESSLTGIYMDQEGRLTFANQKFAEIYGYSRDELEGLDMWKIVHPEDRALTNEFRSKRLLGEDAPADYEVRGLKKTGEIVWVLKRNARIEYDGQPVILGNVIDITQRKEMEAALKESERKLRSFSSSLMTAQEMESRRLSVELHDELGQALLALKLQVRAIERKLREDQKTLKKDCEHTLSYIDQTVENVRRIAQDLNPSILEDLGLTAALRWLVEEFLEYHEVESSVEISEIDHLFPREKEIIVYRIIQEAFTNISKHARASRVLLAIKKCDGMVTFHVEDNGSGFDVGQVPAKGVSKRGLGLAAMDQRIRMLGGIPALWSRRGVGTSISFSVSVSAEGSP